MVRLPRTSGTRYVPALLDGFAQGTLLFGGLLLAELIALGPSNRASIGSSFSIVASVYLLTGAVLGAALGLGSTLIARKVPVRPASVSFALLLCVCAALFALRATTAAQLTTFQPRVAVIATAVVSVAAFVMQRSRRPGETETHRTRSLCFVGVVVAGGACALAIGWTPLRHHRLPADANAPADAPNVVFVLVDALRADRLSGSGYPRNTTPFIDGLASRGVSFGNAYSHGNRTIIAMPSLFTSIYPSYARTIESGNWSTPLPDSQTTLAEMFREAGYTTFGMMANPFLKRPFGLTQGFDRVEEFDSGRFGLSLYRIGVALGFVEKPRSAHGITASATEVTDAALAWLRRVPSRSPVFCYVHYMDVHHPYLPPRVFEDMFNSQDWLSSIDPAALFAKTVELVREKRPYPLDKNELTRLSDLYDACIRYVDSEVARLVNEVQHANGRPTVVVFTSDHGDEFQEHGFLYHNNVVIEELIRVPLVIWRSDRQVQNRRVDDLVRHVDVLPTLAEWLDFDVPPHAVGRSLVPLMEGRTNDAPRATIAEGDYCGAVIEPGWKSMRVDTTNTDWLFDLGADPQAKRDVAAFHPDRHQRMRGVWDAYVLGAPTVDATTRPDVDAATLRQLQALGYIN